MERVEERNRDRRNVEQDRRRVEEGPRRFFGDLTSQAVVGGGPSATDSGRIPN